MPKEVLTPLSRYRQNLIADLMGHPVIRSDGLSNDLEITPERELVALEERPRLHHGAEVDADRDALHVGPGEHPDMMSALEGEGVHGKADVVREVV